MAHTGIMNTVGEHTICVCACVRDNRTQALEQGYKQSDWMQRCACLIVHSPLPSEHHIQSRKVGSWECWGRREMHLHLSSHAAHLSGGGCFCAVHDPHAGHILTTFSFFIPAFLPTMWTRHRVRVGSCLVSGGAGRAWPTACGRLIPGRTGKAGLQNWICRIHGMCTVHLCSVCEGASVLARLAPAARDMALFGHLPCAKQYSTKSILTLL